MAAAVGIEATQRSYGAEAVRKVAEVAVSDRDRAWPEVDGEAGPNALGEVEESCEARLPVGQLLLRVCVVLVGVGLPVLQSTCVEQLAHVTTRRR